MFDLQILISTIGNTASMFTIVFGICLALYFAQEKKESLKIGFSVIVSTCVTFIIKHICQVPRLDTILVTETSYRFPSGHATMAATASALVIYYASLHIKNDTVRYFVYCLAAVWYVLVSYSRIYLNAHILVDVLVGGLIGIFSVVFVVKIFKHFHYYNN